jgi:hypothetical protein
MLPAEARLGCDRLTNDGKPLIAWKTAACFACTAPSLRLIPQNRCLIPTYELTISMRCIF